MDKQKLETIIDLEQGIRTSIIHQTQLLETLTPEEAKCMNNLVYKKDNTIWDWSKGFPGHSIGLNTANCPVKMTDIDSLHLDHAGRVWLFEHKFIYRGIEDNQLRVQKELYDRIAGAKAFVICSSGMAKDHMEPKVLELHDAQIQYLSIDGVEIKRRCWIEDHWKVGLLLALINEPDYGDTIEKWKNYSLNYNK